MRTMPFQRSPVDVTIGEGLAIGARYWAGSWDRWLLAVIAVGLANGLVAWLFPTAAVDDATMNAMLGSGTADATMVPSLLAGPIAAAIVGLVADWFLTANAIAGLRGREVTLPWVLAAGLRTLVVLFAVSLLLTVLLLLLLVLGPIGLIVTLGLVPAALYAAVRLAFWELALFDGAGVETSLRRSWSLTDGAVLRVFGWALALMGLSLLLSLLATGLGVLLPGLGIATATLGALVSTAFQAYAVIVTAILYESQQLRVASGPGASWGGRGTRDPWAGPPAATPPPGWGRPADPDRPVDPDAPPPPPPPHDPGRG
jgi:hypothetical protein